MGRLGDLPERVRDQLLRRELPVPAGKRSQAYQPRDRTEPGQIVREAVGHSSTVVRARHVGTPDVTLHGPIQPRALEKLPRHESGDLFVQMMTAVTSHLLFGFFFLCCFKRYGRTLLQSYAQ